MQLRKVLFWDTDPDQVDWDRHSRYVIERVVKFGTLNEWQQLLAFYGEQKVKETVCTLRDLDRKTYHYLSVRFNIPKEKFECYTQLLSHPKHYPS